MSYYERNLEPCNFRPLISFPLSPSDTKKLLQAGFQTVGNILNYSPKQLSTGLYLYFISYLKYFFDLF